MLKLIIRQANWGILGSIFAFAIGFFVTIHFYYTQIKNFFLKIFSKFFKKNNTK